MRHSRDVIAALVVLSAAVVLTACGGDNGSSTKSGDANSAGTGSMTAVLPSRSIPYYRDLAAGVTAETKRQGWQLDVVFGDQSAPTELSQIQTALAHQPDAMVIAPVDEQALIPAYRQVSGAGIPIATVSDNIGEAGYPYQLAYVGHAYEELGRKKAQWIVDQLGGQGKVGMVHAIRGLNFTEAQDRGAKEVFAKHPGIKLIDGPYVGDFTSDLGLDGTANLLSREPNLDAIYVDNDDLALGAIQAVKQAGISNDNILVVGTDGGPPALEAVVKGELDATWSLCGYYQGVVAARTLIENVNDGVDPSAFVPTRQLMLTQQNIAEKTADLTTEDCNSAVEQVAALIKAEGG